MDLENDALPTTKLPPLPPPTPTPSSSRKATSWNPIPGRWWLPLSARAQASKRAREHDETRRFVALACGAIGVGVVVFSLVATFFAFTPSSFPRDRVALSVTLVCARLALALAAMAFGHALVKLAERMLAADGWFDKKTSPLN